MRAVAAGFVRHMTLVVCPFVTLRLILDAVLFAPLGFGEWASISQLCEGLGEFAEAAALMALFWLTSQPAAIGAAALVRRKMHARVKAQHAVARLLA